MRVAVGGDGLVALCLLLLAPWTVLLAAHARAGNLDALFPEKEASRQSVSAERVVRSAFDAVFGFDGAMLVESVTRTRDGGSERLRFRLYRKRFYRVRIPEISPEDDETRP